jgi:hypothetical protein
MGVQSGHGGGVMVQREELQVIGGVSDWSGGWLIWLLFVIAGRIERLGAQNGEVVQIVVVNIWWFYYCDCVIVVVDCC